MANLEGFDATAVEPAESYESLPAGKYVAVIATSDNKPTKAGTGHYLELKFQIIEGPHKGRLIWSRLNLDNPNATAVQIARGELAAICRAVGVMAPKDSQELHDRPLVIHVRCRKRQDTDEIVNEIKGYSAREQPTPVSAPEANGVPPWRRNS